MAPPLSLSNLVSDTSLFLTPAPDIVSSDRLPRFCLLASVFLLLGK